MHHFSIDDECDLYGIQMVKLQDPQLAKRYGIKTFPALVYFRNGNPLTFEGKYREGRRIPLINYDDLVPAPASSPPRILISL